MKRKCKSVDIYDVGLITTAVFQCFAPCRKRRRHDTIHLFSEYMPDKTKKEVRESLRKRDADYTAACHLIAEDIHTSLESKDLKLTIPRQVERVDVGSGKLRKISVLGIRQLIFDHIAVLGLEELSKRIGVTQVSSIKGRGAHYGLSFLKHWLRSKKKKLYFTKLDVKDFYGSIDRECLMNWLKARINNKPLIWLINKLVYSVPTGIAIGSFLSQTLANIYLSDLYHFAKEKCRYRKNRLPQVKYALFYMDDMLFVGPNKRQLTRAVISIIDRAKKVLHLTIKPDWQVHLASKRHPVDMMGFRVSPGKCVSLRKRIFKCARRILKRIGAVHGHLSLRQALRVMSYKGYLTSTDTRTVQRRLHAIKFYSRAANTISSYALSTC